MTKPIISPFPLFGPDNYAYLRTLIRYNTMKSGYDATIYSAISPDYINPVDIGSQSKVREHGSYKKYTSLISDQSIENLVFEIKIPIRAKYKAEICAELSEIESGNTSPEQIPLGWSYMEYLSSDYVSDNNIILKFFDANQEEKKAEYFFANVQISNFAQEKINKGTESERDNPVFKKHKLRLRDRDLINKNTDANGNVFRLDNDGELKEYNDAGRMPRKAKDHFFQYKIKPSEGELRRFVVRVNMTIKNGQDVVMDEREDAIILDIYN